MILRDILRPLLLGVLLLQTACVSMVMAAANVQEVEDRHALKRWFAKDPVYASCSEPIMIAPIIYHDFDRDENAELVVDAASCNNANGDADIHAVLSPDGNGGFSPWQIAELPPEHLAPAGAAGSPGYRLGVDEQGQLIATWRDRPSLTVHYRPVDGDSKAFAVYEVVYSK